jgi:hypothetical protein
LFSRSILSASFLLTSSCRVLGLIELEWTWWCPTYNSLPLEICSSCLRIFSFSFFICDNFSEDKNDIRFKFIFSFNLNNLPIYLYSAALIMLYCNYWFCENGFSDIIDLAVSLVLYEPPPWENFELCIKLHS